MEAIVKTDFHFPGQKSVYKGKVRDVYNIKDEYLVMLVSDRDIGIRRRSSERYSLQRSGIESDCLQISGCNGRYRSELENRNARPDGYNRSQMRTVQSRNGYPGLSDR